MPKSESFLIRFIDRGVEPKERPNPRYPNGIDLDMSQGVLSCYVPLPYPAPRCGFWRVQCLDCGFSVAVTCAGRKDDPRSVKLPCKGGPAANKTRLQ